MISLYEIIDISTSNNTLNFIELLLSSQGYRIWTTILNYDVYELSTNVVFLLNSSMYSPHDKLQDIIDYFFESDILTKQIIPLLQRESTFINAYNEHINNSKQCDLVNSSLCLFGVLITNRGTNHEHKSINYKNEEIIIYTIIDIFLKYISIDNESYLRYIFYGLSQLESLHTDIYFEYFAGKTNIIDVLINPKFQTPEYSKVIFYGHRAIGNLFGGIEINKYYTKDYIVKLFEHFALYLNSKTFIFKKESAWVISNMVVDCDDIVKMAIDNDILMKALVKYFDNETDQSLIYEGILVVQILITKADFNRFFRLMELGFFNIIMNLLKVDFFTDFVKANLFLCVFNCLKRGEVIAEQIGGNKILEKFLEMEGKEIVLKYVNTDDRELKKILEEIEGKYLNEYCGIGENESFKGMNNHLVI